MSGSPRFVAHVRHDYHGAGQGLFCHGELQLIEPARKCFTWIHDCGADKADFPSLHREIARVRRDLGDRQIIDLLILSHFDEDHIAGLQELLRNVTVRWLVLPYMRPADLMLYAIARGATATGRFARYAYDPVSLLAEFTSNGTIQNVIQVGGETGEAGRNRTGRGSPEQEPLPPPNRDDFLEVEWEGALLIDESPEVSSRNPRAPRVFHAISSPRLRCGDIWEFLFLNKPAWRGNPAALRKAVDVELDSVRAGRIGLPTAVRRIKRLYRHSNQFGRSATGRNNISLLSYAGPICDSASPVHVHRHACALVPSDFPVAWPSWNTPGWSRLIWKPASLLYTGDVTLNASLRQAAQTQWGTDRWRRIEFLQVPHHGAKDSWQESDLSQWTQQHSVFSYGTTNSHHHPHPSVVKALRAHGPILVNEFQGFTWACLIEWRHLSQADVHVTADF